MTDMLLKKDFRALRHKLASGKVLADAASEAGMSLDEAQAYLKSRDEEEDETLLAFSDEALRVALMALKRAVREKNRSVASILYEKDNVTGDSTKTESRESVIDVDAAKALLKAGMQAKKMLRDREGSGGAVPAGQKDLFDGPWTFKKSD